MTSRIVAGRAVTVDNIACQCAGKWQPCFVCAGDLPRDRRLDLAIATGGPEAPTWAMLLLGFLVLASWLIGGNHFRASVWRDPISERRMKGTAFRRSLVLLCNE